MLQVLLMNGSKHVAEVWQLSAVIIATEIIIIFARVPVHLRQHLVVRQELIENFLQHSEAVLVVRFVVVVQRADDGMCALIATAHV